LANLDTELVTVPASEGTVRNEDLAAAVDDRTACVVVQHPNFFGCLEDVRACGEIARQAGAMFVVAVDPISLGLLARPGEYGADIVVAEGQSLGNPMSFGGPYLGILACREQLVRRMPGRLVGQTVDRRGNRCWVLTLQTREQHIRREKATSNICTNQGLLALRAAVYLAAMGPHGIRSVAELCVQKAHYALERLTAAGMLRPAFDRPVFKEFVVRADDGRVEQRLQRAFGEGLLAGVPLDRWYPELADCFLVAVTEKRTKQQIDRLAEVLASA
jgi:glycine dehydrogenase subunit 1